MKYNEILKLAKNELRSSKIPKSIYEPLYYKFLFTLGVKAIPPHYKSFKANFLNDSVGIGAGTILVIIIWSLFSKDEYSAINVLVSSFFVGTIFGVAMGFISALYYFLSAKNTW